MHAKLKRVLLLSILVMGYFGANAQKEGNFKTFPVQVGLLNTNIAAPLTNRLFNGFNPGIKIGTEIYYNKRQSLQLFQSAEIGFMSHKHYDKSLFLASQFGVRPKYRHIFVDLKLGLGYMLSKSKYVVYIQEDDNEFVKYSQHLNKALITAGISIGYEFQKLKVFAGYSCMAETPYLKNESSFLTRQITEIGLRMPIHL